MQKKTNKEHQPDPIYINGIGGRSEAFVDVSKISELSDQMEEFKKAVLYVIENSPDDSLHNEELKKIF
jgi:hypothetical protein